MRRPVESILEGRFWDSFIDGTLNDTFNTPFCETDFIEEHISMKLK